MQPSPARRCSPPPGRPHDGPVPDRRDVDGTFTMEAQIKSGKVALPLEIRVYKPVILDSEVTVPQSLGVAEGWLNSTS